MHEAMDRRTQAWVERGAPRDLFADMAAAASRLAEQAGDMGVSMAEVHKAMAARCKAPRPFAADHRFPRRGLRR